MLRTAGEGQVTGGKWGVTVSGTGLPLWSDEDILMLTVVTVARL